MSNEEMNQSLYAFVREWVAKSRLALSGVNVADCMAYDALSVVGRQIVNSLPEPDTPQPEAQHG